MKTLRLLSLSLLMLGCGETASTEAAPATAEAPAAEAPAAEGAAPVVAEAAAAPARIGTYGMFQLSANTISVDGHCMEVAADLPADAAEAAGVLEGLRSTATRQARAAGPDAVSDSRCPTEGRVPELTGCAMTMGLGAYIYYYYTTGPTAFTADSARAECTQVHGEWID